jgi:hypothetical protein
MCATRTLSLRGCNRDSSDVLTGFEASLIILHVKTAKKQLSQDGEGKERAKRTSTPPNRTLRFGNIEIISSTIELQWRGLQDELDARIREFEDTRHN